jgi:outer membrane protein TolC
MLKHKIIFLLLLILAGGIKAQTLTLQQVIDSIKTSHPVIKMYDSEIRAMDEGAKGARSWMPPQFGVGQFMTPYNVNLWKKNGDEPGMGSIMISGEQMFPNKKQLDANEAYMQAMSSVEAEKKNATLNDLVSEAKGLYYDWIMLKKKQSVISENEKILEFMIKNAEIRYKNGIEKISAITSKSCIGKFKEYATNV